MADVLQFNRETAVQFKRSYLRAKADGKSSFLFGGSSVVVDYAKYVVEHLENEFGPLQTVDPMEN